MPSSTTDSPPQAYEELRELFEPIIYLSDAGSMLDWDQQVMMPAKGTPARAKQRGAVSGLRHELLADDEVATLLGQLKPATLSDQQAAIVREIRRQHERAAAVPRALVEEIQETAATAHTVWESARETDDFAEFAPYLTDLVELRREYAAHIDPDRDPYAVLVEEYEPYLTIETIDEVLTELRSTLVPLIEAIQSSSTELSTDSFDGNFDPKGQEAFSKAILDALGFDWDRGRLDRSTHPFTAGTQFDTRITTRFAEDDPLVGLYSTIHEFGHAQYNLGVPQAEYGTPLGESCDLTVHESQSRLWENHVGRSRAFWEFAQPKLAKRFDSLAETTPAAAYEAANQVYPDNLIRVEADELTYHLHIVIRYEIERELISGDLAVESVPAAWNDKYASYLGTRPPTDAAGCLQDVHWSNGMIGYFPTYSLGSVLAAQLFDTMREELPDINKQVRNGDFSQLTEWLRTNVHQHGRRYETDELVTVASGDPLSADSFLEYVQTKYASLYEL